MPNGDMNVSAASWLGIRASWTHTHGGVSTFPRHRPLTLCMHVYVAYWPMAVAWERRCPSVCVRPGRTDSQPRHCAHIHDTVQRSSQRKSYTLITVDDLVRCVQYITIDNITVIKMRDTDL